MATPETYSRLRDMTGTKNLSEWTDERLDTYLAVSLIADDEDREPGDDGYINTYDLHKAAARIFRDRAAAVADVAYDTQTDMTKANRTGIVVNFLKMARYHEQKSQPLFASLLKAWPLKPLPPNDNISVDA